jgi:hypothetical protein
MFRILSLSALTVVLFGAIVLFGMVFGTGLVLAEESGSKPCLNNATEIDAA